MEGIGMSWDTSYKQWLIWGSVQCQPHSSTVVMTQSSHCHRTPDIRIKSFLGSSTRDPFSISHPTGLTLNPESPRSKVSLLAMQLSVARAQSVTVPVTGPLCKTRSDLLMNIFVCCKSLPRWPLLEISSSLLAACRGRNVELSLQGKKKKKRWCRVVWRWSQPGSDDVILNVGENSYQIHPPKLFPIRAVSAGRARQATVAKLKRCQLVQRVLSLLARVCSEEIVDGEGGILAPTQLNGFLKWVFLAVLLFKKRFQ